MTHLFAGQLRDFDAAAKLDRARLNGEMGQMRAELHTAQKAAEALRQAEADRKARGLLARLSPTFATGPRFGEFCACLVPVSH